MQFIQCSLLLQERNVGVYLFTEGLWVIFPTQALFHENSWSFVWIRIPLLSWQHGIKKWPLSTDALESVESQSSHLSDLSLGKICDKYFLVKNFIRIWRSHVFSGEFLGGMLEIRCIHSFVSPGRIILSSPVYILGQLGCRGFSGVEFSTLCWTEVY